MTTKNLAIMFTDVVGFTSKTSLLSRSQTTKLLATLNKIITSNIVEFEGRLVKSLGDGHLVVFDSPTNAVLSGIAIQREIERSNSVLGESKKMKLKVAINSGDVTLDGGDVFGEPVNLAARIVNLAMPGEVFFSEAVLLSMNKNEIATSKVGMRVVKGVPEKIRIYKVKRKHLDRSGFLKDRKNFKMRGALAGLILFMSVAGLVFATNTGGETTPQVLSETAPPMISPTPEIVIIEIEVTPAPTPVPTPTATAEARENNKFNRRWKAED